ncbi:hypothetical protein B0H66DRAFT_530639 [Apodospora peruviana]|uniref:Uncharacterized protein n=1 Tax=Apodospora peruviana TaxID=516989 RepID=A0AAE0MD47_9PEZI|nr:hypothetical protein B0H66DRAFT_530639 [Apodospora peruviana]
MDTVTAVFTPDPACFASSNLWLQTTQCTTQYPAFQPRPTEVLTDLKCPYTVLGPRQNGDKADNSCYQYNAYTKAGTAYSACPLSMTAAGEETTTFSSDITLIQTVCCPDAYNFAAPSETPAVFPSAIDNITYSMYLNTEILCKATSVQQLSGQTVTLTRATTPEVATTEAAWDNENGILFATPQYLQKYIYKGVSTTSTCYGNSCPEKHNPFVPPTPTPTRFIKGAAYIPPPSHPLTQFTPAPSCLPSADNLWLVSSSCYLANGPYLESPPWLQCTLTEAGEPDISKTACYQNGDSSTTGPDGTASFYSTCPAGYTVALSDTYRPFDEPRYGGDVTKTYDAVVSAFTCCPTGFDFVLRGDIDESTTVHDGTAFTVNLYPMPICVQTSVSALASQEVTMKLFSDDRVWDRKLRPRETEAVITDAPVPTTTTTATWDVEHDTLYAQAEQISYVVFHKTYTCYESCSEYFTYSYYNTDPDVTPPETTSVPSVARSNVTVSGTGGVGTGTGWYYYPIASQTGLAGLVEADVSDHLDEEDRQKVQVWDAAAGGKNSVKERRGIMVPPPDNEENERAPIRRSKSSSSADGLLGGGWRLLMSAGALLAVAVVAVLL